VIRDARPDDPAADDDDLGAVRDLRRHRRMLDEYLISNTVSRCSMLPP
jgi:hypothetical protein